MLRRTQNVTRCLRCGSLFTHARAVHDVPPFCETCASHDFRTPVEVPADLETLVDDPDAIDAAVAGVADDLGYDYDEATDTYTERID